MKKRLYVIGLVVCLLLGCYALIRDQKEQDTNEYCYQINQIIKDLDFYTAEVTENGIVLYDRNFDERETVPFDGYRRNIKIWGIHKSDKVICFVLSGSVDDEQGLMFVNDEANRILDGVNSIDRVGGNYYYYDTQQSIFK